MHFPYLLIHCQNKLFALHAKINAPVAQNNLTKQTIDLAMLSAGLLKGEQLSKFIKRSLEIMN